LDKAIWRASRAMLLAKPDALTGRIGKSRAEATQDRTLRAPTVNNGHKLGPAVVFGRALTLGPAMTIKLRLNGPNRCRPRRTGRNTTRPSVLSPIAPEASRHGA